MVRYFILALFLFVVAGSSHAQSGTIYSQAFEGENATNAVQSFAIPDDFVPFYSSHLTDIHVWMIFSGAMPPSLAISILRDNGSMDPNNAILKYSDVLPAEFEDTGYEIFGYPIYKGVCSSEDWILLNEGVTYWLNIFVPNTGYLIVQEPPAFGSEMFVYDSGVYVPGSSKLGYEADTFFEIHGTVALQRNSWGSIKASF